MNSEVSPVAAQVGTAPLRDALDRALLALLQTNARESAANLARKLGAARTTVLARLSRLEREGIIAGYTVRLAQDVRSQGLQAFVGLTLAPKAGREVEARLARMPEVRQLCAVSGEFDCCCVPSRRCGSTHCSTRFATLTG
jgi:DNA-binding Lrp family transcriptional regulator